MLSRDRLLATPWTVDYQASLSMGFSRQEYWSGLPFPSPGHFPDPGIELVPLNIHKPPRFLPQLLILPNVFLALTSEELCYLPGVYLSTRLRLELSSPSHVLTYANIYQHFTRVRKNGKNCFLYLGEDLYFYSPWWVSECFNCMKV